MLDQVLMTVIAAGAFASAISLAYMSGRKSGRKDSLARADHLILSGTQWGRAGVIFDARMSQSEQIEMLDRIRDLVADGELSGKGSPDRGGDDA